VANIIVVVDGNRGSKLSNALWWGGRSLYPADHYMAELSYKVTANRYFLNSNKVAKITN